MRFLEKSAISSLTQSLLVIALLSGAFMGIYLLVNMGIVLRHADDLQRYPMTATFELPVDAGGHASQMRGDMDSRLEFGLFKLWGEYQYLRVPRLLAVGIFLERLYMLGLFLWVVILLLKMFRTLEAGSPFVAGNAGRLRTIGRIVVIGPLIDALWRAAAFYHLIHVLGAPLPFRDFISFYTWFQDMDFFRPLVLLAGLIVLVIADVFRLGTDMAEDQTLTV